MDNELDTMLLIKNQDTDALKWAKSFNWHMAKNGEQPYNEGTLIGWFANAMCVQMDSTRSKCRDEISQLRELVNEAAIIIRAKDFTNEEEFLREADLILKYERNMSDVATILGKEIF